MIVQYIRDIKGQLDGFTECYLIVNGLPHPFLPYLYTPSPMLETDQINLFARYGVNFTPNFVNVLTHRQRLSIVEQFLKRQEVKIDARRGLTPLTCSKIEEVINMEPLYDIPILVGLLIAIATLVWDETKEVISKRKKDDNKGNSEKFSHSLLNILI